MTRLRHGSSLIQWPRTVSAVAAGNDPIAIETVDPQWLETMSFSESARQALAEHLCDGDDDGEDPVLAARLAILDSTYGSWIPGFLEKHAARLSEARALHARRRVLAHRGVARPTLPVCTVRRALAMESEGHARVLIDDDPDGVAIILAAGSASISVSAIASHPCEQRWYEFEAERASLGGRLQLHSHADEIEAGSVDAAMVHVGSPAESRRALSLAIRAVRSKGRIYARVRAPWDRHLVQCAKEAKLKLIDHIREIDHPVVPGGFVVDGAGDLVIFERTESTALIATEDSAAAEVRAMPYLPLDFHSLDETRLDERPMQRLFDAVAAASALPEQVRTIMRQDGRQTGAWYDDSGIGLSAELNLSEAHLLVSLMPYDGALEWAVQCAVFHTLGDHLSRLRPHRTMYWREENVFG